MKQEILVLGATGKTGKRVAKKLRQLNMPIRAGSRKGNPPFDWDDPGNWLDVLADIKAVYICFQPDMVAPGALEKIHSFVEAAKQSGVQKLVLLSGRGEIAAQNGEKIVIDSGLNWTIVRASWFMQNFSEGFFLDSILENHFVVPVVKALEPFVDVDDIADVVVEALRNDKHNGKIYELTGTELLSFKDATAMISDSINRPVTFQEVSIHEYIAMLKSYQLPEDAIWLITYLFTEVLDGRNESVSNDVENILGRKPTTFREYIIKTKISGVWKTQ